MYRGHQAAVECGIEFPPLTGRNNWASSKTKRLKHRTDPHRIGREHFAKQRYGWPLTPTAPWRCNRALLCLTASILKHRPSENIFGLSMGWNTKTGDIDTNDANAINFFGQQLKGNSASSRYAKVHDDD